ncbi:MAG TPA: GGDEF domain-containing protein [Puia sp.]|jgi:diguanylate cyclase (GGDEF)-like protein
MIKFLREVFPELQKDLFKDGVKYLIAAALGVIGLWAAARWEALNVGLKRQAPLTWYTLIVFLFLVVILTSFVTYIIQNRKYQRLKKDSLKDELTGLANYKAFPGRLKESMTSAKKDKKAISVILIDVDNFKQINDRYLLSGGDNVMAQLGAYLGEDSRASDIVCRQHMKGDEFVIIALGTNKDQARMAAERKRKEISEKEFQIGRTDLVKITVSCGIAEGHPESDTAESILEKANKALLRAKALGKDKSITYED